MAKQTAKRILWYSDVHWSDRDEQALGIVEKAAEAFKPHIIVDLGDLLNCDAFSRFPKQTIDDDDEYDYLNGELEPAWKWSRKMEGYASERMVQLAGNHCQWYSRWIAAVDDGRRAFKSLRPEKYMLRDRKPGFKYIPSSKQHGDRRGAFKLSPNILFVHGWSATKYAASWHLERSKPLSVIFGHTHRAETCTRPMYDHRYVQAINAGCLCNRQPKYAHGGSPTEWATGFGVLYAGRKSFTAYPIAIHKSSAVLPSGEEIRG